MVGARSDIVAPLSRLLDELLGRLEILNIYPPMSRSRSTDALVAASQAKELAKRQDWQSWQPAQAWRGW